MIREGLVGRTAAGETLRVREVWQDNLEAEMSLIESIVEDYPYLAMDTEFPGTLRSWSPQRLALTAQRVLSA